MPLKIPDTLPALQILRDEHVPVIPESVAFRQDIRPLRVAILNLMPKKIATETQLLRLLGNSPLQISVTFLRMGSRASTHTAPEHLEKFYKSFDEVRAERFDCLIVTGAPVEELAFEEVSYWAELSELLEWSRSHAYSSLHICWGAQAALYHHYGVGKHALHEKLSGVFRHRVCNERTNLTRGFDDSFYAPHSRHTSVNRESLLDTPVRILAESESGEVYLAATEDERQIFVTGHPEYDRLTLKEEYERDKKAGLNARLPERYFPFDDPLERPAMPWRSHAHLLFSNWLHGAYQKTPFNLADLKPL